MRRFLSSRPSTIRTAPGERIYAIGDIHGRDDLLRDLMARLIAHWEQSEKSFKTIRVIFLGDVIDRGPGSRRALWLIHALLKQSGVELLRGNHEGLLLRSMDGDGWAQDLWLQHGGLETLAALQVEPPLAGEDTFDFADRLTAAVPVKLLNMLKAAPVMARSGDYAFVHAGVRPGVSLAKQDEFDLTFIREEFTDSADWHGAMVVHGHTIVEQPEFHENRIAIDTGAWRSGRLTCLCLSGEDREIIST